MISQSPLISLVEKTNMVAHLLQRRLVSSAAVATASCLEFSPSVKQNSWVASNRLFQLHPRLHALEQCGTLRDLLPIFAYTIISGLFGNPFVASRILLCTTSLTPPCPAFTWKVFAQMDRPNSFSWNTLIRSFAGFDEREHLPSAFNLYAQMLKRGSYPDNHTFPFLLKASRCSSDIFVARLLHVHSTVFGFDSDPFVQSALMGMYFSCGCLEDARLMFERMPQRDVVCWTGMISGLVDQDCFVEALGVFNSMRRDGFSACPNVATMVSVLSACANLGSLHHTSALQAYMEKVGLVVETYVCNSLIDAYAKCGNPNHALELFGRMSQRDLHSWTAIIMCLATHGQGKEALGVFLGMKRSGFMPDNVTFIAVLSSCSHAGLVSEGRKQFESMVREYKIVPEMKHYGCMVDLLGRAGLLYEAFEFILAMSHEPNLEILGSLLSACRVYNNLQLGKIVSEKIASICAYKGGSDVLLSNIYANENKWHDVIYVRKEMKRQGRKPPGQSWIEVNGIIHEFVVEDKAHPYAGEMIFILDSFRRIL